jgi:predicted O-methyltransferase YrrM
MGQGRNSIYLALNGWRVTGFDPSDEGIRIARTAAERAGVQITTVIATDDEFDFGLEAWDLIVVTYVKTLDKADAHRIERALRPGGVLVYENAATDDNELLQDFADFRILRFEDALDYPDWNPNEKIRIHRLVAQRRVNRSNFGMERTWPFLRATMKPR